ncbi:hypothetical protein BDQ17DRAFT_1457914 [Cyathus striatus]|nr:hypothetical protein BDQ17DRAFT_1457914 [Cyathus striatus]
MPSYIYWFSKTLYVLAATWLCKYTRGWFVSFKPLSNPVRSRQDPGEAKEVSSTWFPQDFVASTAFISTFAHIIGLQLHTRRSLEVVSHCNPDFIEPVTIVKMNYRLPNDVLRLCL